MLAGDGRCDSPGFNAKFVCTMQIVGLSILSWCRSPNLARHKGQPSICSGRKAPLQTRVKETVWGMESKKGVRGVIKVIYHNHDARSDRSLCRTFEAPKCCPTSGKKLPRNWTHKGMFLCVPHGLFQINSQGSCYWHRTLHSRGENYVSVSERFACKCK